MSPEKKSRVRGEQLSRRGRERLQKLGLRFDLLAAALAVVIVVATAICMGEPYELGKPEPHGFALWFLLFLGYLPMELLSLFNWCFGLQETRLMHFLVVEQPAVMLGACNLATLAVLWVVFRFWAARRYGANFLQTTVHFLEILLVWGLFQIGCLVGLEVWDRGGFTPMHRHLTRPAEPEKVILIDSAK